MVLLTDGKRPSGKTSVRLRGKHRIVFAPFDLLVYTKYYAAATPHQVKKRRCAMDRETITAESLLRDIYEAESALRWFEQKYGLLSETFYRVYQQGQLRDEDPDEIQEYMEWSGWCEIRQDRRQRYAQAVEQRL